MPSAVRSIFVYALPESGTEWDSFCGTLSNHGFNQIIISFSDSWIALGETEQARRIAFAKSAGIDILAMNMESTKYLTDPLDNNPAEELATLSDWNSTHPEAKFAGVVIDVEPHSLFSEIADEKKAPLCATFADMLSELALSADLKNDMPGWICVGWWYNRRAVDGTYPDLALAPLSSGYAGLIPMVYGGIGGTALELETKAADSLSAAPTIIGVGASEYATWNSLLAALNTVDLDLKNNANYRGTVVFESRELMSLPDW